MGRPISVPAGIPSAPHGARAAFEGDDQTVRALDRVEHVVAAARERAAGGEHPPMSRRRYGGR
ncbi:hypothetical protein ACQP1K_18275 [Sphaerimonospora sp. CA-214678]|uniref:hypothetical protein n=1 Tax=Sphaerimonospora sp. CA-214678 TaxID=3240029 RepID=UPI003D8F699B